jgi:gliding motility-associated-like protein
VGSAVANSDHTITFTPQADFSGNINFEYQVCVVVKGFSVCDTADVCINVVDTNVYCHFPNTITPNGNSGMNGIYIISCNDQYPLATLNIYDRWGAEVYRSGGHYLNDWQGTTPEGKPVPDGTYFYMYYYNDGSNRVKSGFVDVYR